MWKLNRLFKMRPLAALVTGALIALNILLAVPGGVSQASFVLQKELNFVFLHGMGATVASMQLLADTINELAPAFIWQYQKDNPETTIKINMLQRSYPNTVDVRTWSNNTANAVQKYFYGRENLILVGHSMGGKAALYAAANNPYLSKNTAMVVTINSPVKSLDSYYVVGGGSVTDYLRTTRAITDKGVAASLSSYDSSSDGFNVAKNKHWLAFISAESAPMDPRYDFTGLDAFPEDMDDGLVPISAQYAAGADVVYYGEHGHSDFGNFTRDAEVVAGTILRYIFGGEIKTSAPISDGRFEHYAGWLPVKYYWNDRLGETSIIAGTISHTNTSLVKWQEWEDIAWGYSVGTVAGTFDVRLTSFPLLSDISQARWLNPENPADSQLYIKTRAAPGAKVSLQWMVHKYKPLPPEIVRDHYEIKVVDGTSLVGITRASWLTDNTTDIRISADSQGEGPFHWFKAEYKVFYQQTVMRNVIDVIPHQVLGE